MDYAALWLRAEDGYAVLSIEHEKRWVELMREPLDSPFSHITEPLGIRRLIDPRCDYTVSGAGNFRCSLLREHEGAHKMRGV